MDIYEKVKKEVEEKNRLKVGDTCVYFGDVPWLVYRNCVVHEVRGNGEYMVKFPDGGLEIVLENELVNLPGLEWQPANIASSLPYIPYDYKKTQNLLYGVNGTNIDRPVVERHTFRIKHSKEEEEKVKEEFKVGDKVRCIGVDLISFGKVGEVVSTSYRYDVGEQDIGVKFSDSDWVVHFKNPRSIEKVEDIKFKKGDRVVCIMQPNDSNHKMVGLKGTVLHSDSEGWTMVEFDENVSGHDGGASNGGKLGHCWGMKKEYLKLIDKEEEKKMFGFSIGDKVEYNGYYKPLTGKTFEVIGFKGRLGCSSIEVVIQNEDGDSIGISSKHLKLVSNKEKGEKKDMFNFKVVGAYPNKKKGILAVKFNDGVVIKLACHDDDNFDINVGVALAMAYKSCGSKNAFRRNVEKVTQEVKSKEDKVVEEDKVFVTKKTKSRKVTVNMIPEDSFGYKMKKARRAKKLTQRELAILVGSGVSTIHNYERNDCLPNPKRKAKIIEVLGLK